MMMLASGLDLITLFLGIEVLSISLYILAGFLRDQIRSNESALKYLLMGAFASGFVLYGIAGNIPMRTIFRGIMPFLVAELLCVALLVLFPDLVLWLPRVAGYKVN